MRGEGVSCGVSANEYSCAQINFGGLPSYLTYDSYLPICRLYMRPKARGLAQHGGPPGWVEESDLAGLILSVMDGPNRPPYRTVPVALTGAAQLRAEGISSCCCMVKNVHNHPVKEDMAWYSSIDPCLLYD